MNKQILEKIAVILIGLAIASAIIIFDRTVEKNDEVSQFDADASGNIERLYNESESIDEITPESPTTEADNPPTGDSNNSKSPDGNIDTGVIRGPLKPLQRTAWIPNWGHQSGFNSLKQNRSKFTSISPVWYSPISDGNLDIKKPAGHEAFVQYAKSEGITVIPSIAMFEADVLSAVLNDNSNFNRHINLIVNEVIEYDFDGIDIDYEMIYLKDKELFQAFIKELNRRLDAEDKILSVTVLPQWGDNVIYTSLKETRAVQELKFLSANSDQIRIMTYDYTSSGSPKPGPIAPIDWMENVLKYHLTKTPADKLWLGIHLYGYEWNSGGGVSASTYSDLTRLASITDFKTEHNHTYGEGIATYSCGEGMTCTLFYQDLTGLNAREDLARKYGIAGVAYWRLGGDGNLFEMVE